MSFLLCRSLLCQGLPGCGATIAQRLARYGLGQSLTEACGFAMLPARSAALALWRDDLRKCLRNGPARYLGRRCIALARNIPDTFPDPAVVALYAQPLTSPLTSILPGMYTLDAHPPCADLHMLARLCERHFGWDQDLLLEKFEQFVWPAVALQTIIREIKTIQHGHGFAGSDEGVPLVC